MAHTDESTPANIAKILLGGGFKGFVTHSEITPHTHSQTLQSCDMEKKHFRNRSQEMISWIWETWEANVL